MAEICEKFDNETSRIDSNTNLIELEKELLNEWKKSGQHDPELAWRLAALQYFKSLNIINDEQIRSLTNESKDYGERSIELFKSNSSNSSNIFNAYKWTAMAYGRLALLELYSTTTATNRDSNLEINMTNIQKFLRYLNECRKLFPDKSSNDYLILFMQGHFQLAYEMLNDSDRIKFENNLNKVQMLITDIGGNNAAEHYLRRSIELNPAFLDNYITLAYLLLKQRKILEAKSIIEQGLQQQCPNKSDELIRQELLKIKQTLG